MEKSVRYIFYNGSRVKPQILHDYWYTLTDEDILSTNFISLFCKLQKTINFSFEGDLKLLKVSEKQKQDIFYNQSHIYYIPYSLGLRIDNGIIDKYSKIICQDERYSLEERLIVLRDKSNCFDQDEDVNDDSDNIEEYCELAELFLKKNDPDSIKLAYMYAERAYNISSELHQESLHPLLLMIKIHYEEKDFEKMKQKNEILMNLMLFYHGGTHPLMIKVFEELGDLHYQGGDIEEALNFYREASLVAK